MNKRLEEELLRAGLRLATDEPGWYWRDSTGTRMWVTDLPLEEAVSKGAVKRVTLELPAETQDALDAFERTYPGALVLGCEFDADADRWVGFLATMEQ